MKQLDEMERGLLLTLSGCSDFSEVLCLLTRVVGKMCPNLDEDEIQEYLCNVAAELERTAGRIGEDDGAWVTYSVIRRR